MNIIDQIKEFVAKGQLAPAIKELVEIAKNTYYENRSIMLSGQFHDYKDNQGMMTQEQRNVKKNQIKNEILNLLNDLADEIPNLKERSLPADNTIITHGNGNINLSGISGSSVNIGGSGEKEPDENKSKETVILFLASNPSDTGKLQLAEEFRRVSQRLQESGYGDKFRLYQQWATTADSLQHSILKYKPQIIHFSGHGMGKKSGDKANSRDVFTKTSDTTIDAVTGIILQDSNNRTHVVRTKALSNMFKLFARKIKIEAVLLNACYSKEQAEAICEHIPFVIGMNNTINDTAAIEFTTGFYRGIGGGEDYEFAFDLGQNKIELEGLDDAEVVTLHKKAM